MKKIAFILATLLIIGCTDYPTRQESSFAEEPLVEDSVSEVTILVAGDLMMHMPQINCGYNGDGTYDFDHVFAFVKPEIEKADLAIANFETTLAAPPYSGYPMFCAPDAYLIAIVNAGFDVLTTANNHCCDKRALGLERTIAMMDSFHVYHLGTYVDRESRDKSYPLVIEKNNIRIALLNFTYGTNGLPIPNPCYVNEIDTAEIAADIAMAKLLQSDVIIALPHWGIEYMRTAAKDQKELTDWLIEQGVDHVVGGHPHVIQPFEVRSDSVRGNHLVAFSLGNYVSAQSKPDTDGGAMVRFTLRKENGETRLTDSKYLLHWVSRPNVSGKRKYVIIPASCPDEELTPNEIRQREVFLNSTRRLMEKHNVGKIEEAIEPHP